MIEFGVIGLLILALTFVVVRNQSTHQELKQIRHAHKLLQSHNKYSFTLLPLAPTNVKLPLLLSETAIVIVRNYTTHCYKQRMRYTKL